MANGVIRSGTFLAQVVTRRHHAAKGHQSWRFQGSNLPCTSYYFIPSMHSRDPRIDDWRGRPCPRAAPPPAPPTNTWCLVPAGPPQTQPRLLSRHHLCSFPKFRTSLSVSTYIYKLQGAEKLQKPECPVIHIISRCKMSFSCIPYT